MSESRSRTREEGTGEGEGEDEDGSEYGDEDSSEEEFDPENYYTKDQLNKILEEMIMNKLN